MNLDDLNENPEVKHVLHLVNNFRGSEEEGWLPFDEQLLRLQNDASNFYRHQIWVDCSCRCQKLGHV
jgi:hypothetical protein